MTTWRVRHPRKENRMPSRGALPPHTHTHIHTHTNIHTHTHTHKHTHTHTHTQTADLRLGHKRVVILDNVKLWLLSTHIHTLIHTDTHIHTHTHTHKHTCLSRSWVLIDPILTHEDTRSVRFIFNLPHFLQQIMEGANRPTPLAFRRGGGLGVFLEKKMTGQTLFLGKKRQGRNFLGGKKWRGQHFLLEKMRGRTFFWRKYAKKSIQNIPH